MGESFESVRARQQRRLRLGLLVVLVLLASGVAAGAVAVTMTLRGVDVGPPDGTGGDVGIVSVGADRPSS